MIKTSAVLISLTIHLTLLINISSKELLSTTTAHSLKSLNITFSSDYLQNKVAHKKIEKKTIYITKNSAQSNLKHALKPLAIINPTYPKLSRILEEEGANSIKAKISHSGTVTQTIILKSSGYARLDNSAVNAVWEARFAPAKSRTGSMIRTKIFKFIFKLDN